MEKTDRVCYTCERERLKPSELVYKKAPGTEEPGKCAFCGQRKYSAEYKIRYGGKQYDKKGEDGTWVHLK